MNPETIIQRLANEPSTLVKERIIDEQLRDDNLDFFSGMRLAYDKGITFGISTKTPLKGSGKGLSFSDFATVAQTLVDRVATGGEAVQVLETLAASATPDQWSFWYRPIIMKNLNCGVTSTLVNKVIKAYNGGSRLDLMIPVFDCQLATDINKVNDKNKDALGKVMVQPKLDGVRILARVANGNTTLFSRSGKVLKNFPKIEKDLGRLLSDDGYDPVWIDGEVVSRDFRKLMTQVNRKEDVETDDCTLVIFDLIPDDKFRTGAWSEKNIERHDMLEETFTEERTKGTSLALVESTTLDYRTDQDEINQLIRSHLERGFEGTMVKNAKAPYRAKRTKDWMKVKPTIMLTVKVVDVIEGEGKYVGSLGALICEGEYEGKTIKVSVGGGFSDTQRKEFWSSKGKLVDQLIEIQADAVSQSKEGVYSLRFPRFIMFRGFKTNEQL